MEEVTSTGTHSTWRVRLDGRTAHWEAEIEQFIPNQAIGWKSLSGPKHTGRITFSPIEKDTLVQITMNYAPPSRVLRPFAVNLSGFMQRYIDQVLRDFKAGLEGKGQENASPATRGSSERLTQSRPSRATGTFGGGSADASIGTRPNPVEYNSPPEMKR